MVSVTTDELELTPWIRSVVNCTCVLIIAISSAVMQPTLGPDARRVYIYRSVGYGFAAGVNIASFISLLFSLVLSEENVFLPAVFFISLPIATSMGMYFFIRKRNLDQFQDLKNVCDALSDDSLQYRERMELCLRNDKHAFQFTATLMLSSNDKFKKEVEDKLKLFLSYMREEDFIMELPTISTSPVIDVLDCLIAAQKHPSGIRLTKQVYCRYATEFISLALFKLDSEIMHRQIVKSSSEIEVFVNMLSPIISRSAAVLTSLVEFSKHYKTELQKTYDGLLPGVVRIHNYFVFLQNNNRETIKIHRCINSLRLLINSMQLSSDEIILMIENNKVNAQKNAIANSTTVDAHKKKMVLLTDISSDLPDTAVLVSVFCGLYSPIFSMLKNQGEADSPIRDLDESKLRLRRQISTATESSGSDASSFATSTPNKESFLKKFKNKVSMNKISVFNTSNSTSNNSMLAAKSAGTSTSLSIAASNKELLKQGPDISASLTHSNSIGRPSVGFVSKLKSSLSIFNSNSNIGITPMPSTPRITHQNTFADADVPTSEEAEVVVTTASKFSRSSLSLIFDFKDATATDIIIPKVHGILLLLYFTSKDLTRDFLFAHILEKIDQYLSSLVVEKGVLSSSINVCIGIPGIKDKLKNELLNEWTNVIERDAYEARANIFKYVNLSIIVLASYKPASDAQQLPLTLMNFHYVKHLFNCYKDMEVSVLSQSEEKSRQQQMWYVKCLF